MSETHIPRVFVSFSSSDDAEANRIVSELEARGIACWFAPRDINPGEDYARVIPSALASCQATIVILSRHAIRSQNVRREVEIAGDLRHRFYPVRLEDVELPNELAFFIRRAGSLDLHSGDPQSSVDLLATAIIKKRLLAQRPVWKTWWLWTAALSAIAVLLSAWQLQQFASFRAVSESLVEETEPQELTFDAYASSFTERDALSGLVTYEVIFYGLPNQELPAQISIYRRDAVGPPTIVARTEAQLIKEDDWYKANVPALEAVTRGILCALVDATGLDGTKGRHALVRRLESHTPMDPNRTLTPVEEGQTCDEIVGSQRSDAFQATLDQALTIKQILEDEAVAISGGVRRHRLDRIEYQVSQSRTGGAGSEYFNPRFTYSYLFGSEDGQTWTLLHDQNTNNGARFVQRYGYRRALPTYVRQCTVTRLQTKVGHLQSELHLVADDTTGRYVSLQPGRGLSVHLGRSSECAREAVTHKVGSRHLTGYEEVLSTPSTGYFDPAERQAAIAKLKLGQASPYGPEVNGLRLGMAFDDALAAMRARYPHAGISDLPRTSDSGRIVLVEDGQRYATVALVSHTKIPALAGASFTYEPDDASVSPERMLTRATQFFGPQNGAEPLMHRSDTRLGWSWKPNQQCRIAGYSGPVVVIALFNRKCNGLFLRSRVSRDGQGSSFNDVALVDGEMFSDHLSQTMLSQP